MHHGKVLCFNPHPLFGVIGNVETPNNDYDRDARLERHTPLASTNFNEPELEDSAPVVTTLLLHNCVCGNPAIFHYPTSTCLGFQFGKITPALNPVPPFQLGEVQITTDIIDTKKLGADKNYCRLYSAEDDRDSDSGSD